ncbi:MAG: hypothetical protein HZB25_02355 [Candidatus Eisenbacteria bacterium]|nr:hypothetical protein [Candidatus Eisenbacteria bacterium]
MAAKPKMTRSAYVLLALLALVLAWTQAMDRKVKAMRARAAATATAAPANPASAVTVAVAPAQADVAVVRVAPWGEDPFWKSEAAARSGGPAQRHQPWKPSGRGLKLNGILWGGSEAASSAQICDEVVRVGDKAYRWTILRITQNSVTLTDRGAVITLKLHEDEP